MPALSVQTRYAWWLLFAALIAAIFLVASANPGRNGKHVARLVSMAPQGSPALPGLGRNPVIDVPAVEPTVLQAITPDVAREMNAAIPFIAGHIPPAKPFLFDGAPVDLANATACLAAAVLYEAGDDKLGEQAVGQVVLNRLRHPAFPKTVCGVVFQGSDRQTGCQFTFACDGSLSRIADPAAWRRANVIAKAALSGFVFKPVGTATHYHTDWVVPYWQSSLDKLAQIHTQIFYRWHGGWGLPAAFTGRSLPGEHIDARIGYLAPELAIIVAPVIAPEPTIVANTPAPSATPDLRVEGVSGADLRGSVLLAMDDVGARYVLRLDPKAYPGSYALAALALCRSKPNCVVLGWREGDDGPVDMATIPQAMKSLSFEYRRTASPSAEQIRWDCSKMQRSDAAQCLPVHLQQTDLPVPARDALAAQSTR